MQLFLSLCPWSGGKIVVTSAVVWLISDKMCFLQLQRFFTEEKNGRFGGPEEAANY